MALATYKQTQQYLKPLFRQLKTAKLPEDIRESLVEIAQFMLDRNYIKVRVCVLGKQAWRNEFLGGGTWPWGPLRKGAPSAKRAHKVYVKIANCLKNSTMSVKGSIFRNIGSPLGPLPRDEISGARGDRSPRFLQPCGEGSLLLRMRGENIGRLCPKDRGGQWFCLSSL